MKNYLDKEGFQKAQHINNPKGVLTHASTITHQPRVGEFTCPVCDHPVAVRCINSTKSRPHFAHNKGAPEWCKGHIEPIKQTPYQTSLFGAAVAKNTLAVPSQDKPSLSELWTFLERVRTNGPLVISNDVTPDQRKQTASRLRDIVNYLDPQPSSRNTFDDAHNLIMKVLEDGGMTYSVDITQEQRRLAARSLRSIADNIHEEVAPEPQQIVVSRSTAAKKAPKNYTIMVIRLENEKVWIDYAIRGQELTLLNSLLTAPEYQFIKQHPVVDVVAEISVTCTHDQLKKVMELVSVGSMIKNGLTNVEMKYNCSKLPSIPKALENYRDEAEVLAELARIGSSFAMVSNEIPRHTIMSNSHGYKVAQAITYQ